MNSPVKVITHTSNIPCVHPTRLINRDLSRVKQILTEFRQTIRKPGFKPAFQLRGGSTANVVNDLEDRIRQPWRINQGGASLCGPAAFMYCLAKDAPELYAQYVFDLYVSGKARIHDLVVEPSQACRTGKLSVSSFSGLVTREISAVDWVALASLRDSENRRFRQRSVASDISGITMPRALAEWFSAAGYRWVQQNTQTMASAGSQQFLEAVQHYQHNKNVCLFIAAKVKNSPFTLRAVPNHWVVMSDAVTFSDPDARESNQPVPIEDRIPSVKVYHWGEEQDDLNSTNLSVKDFSRYYFGYVAVR